MRQNDALRRAPSSPWRRLPRAVRRAIAVIAGTAALSFILWPVAWVAVSRTASTAETAPLGVAPGHPAPVLDDLRKSYAELDSVSRFLREAHPDGGYWYWLGQPEAALISTREKE